MKKLFFFFSIVSSFLFLATSNAFAAGGSIAISPSIGTFNKPFTVNVTIDGGGQAFNGAQATVTVSTNLAVTNLNLGDCNFSFLTTPSLNNPSFAGVLLGKSATKCTVYTITLAPVKKGTASIMLAKGSIKRFGDAAEILGSMQQGNYTLTGDVLGATTMASSVTMPKTGLYTVGLHVSSNSQPVTNTSVTMTSVTLHNPLQAQTNNKGFVQFSNITPGIYDIKVKNHVGDTILNIRGSNHILVLGIQVSPQENIFYQATSNPLILGVILLLGILVGIGGTFIILRMHHFQKK